jgi:hypothetical protein
MNHPDNAATNPMAIVTGETRIASWTGGRVRRFRRSRGRASRSCLDHTERRQSFRGRAVLVDAYLRVARRHVSLPSMSSVPQCRRKLDGLSKPSAVESVTSMSRRSVRFVSKRSQSAHQTRSSRRTSR